MDVFSGILNGFAVALSPLNLLYAFVGAVAGTIVGVLPGLGPLGAMAILLSYTLGMDVTSAMILFAGIYYGAMYGGSTTSILLNIPGESASVVTAIDGYQMARRGRAGAALSVAAVGSFVAGTVSIIGLMFLASALADAALSFGPPEYFAIGLVGLLILSRLAGGSWIKSWVMVLTGLIIATVGTDAVSGTLRFTFGQVELGQGIDFLPVAMGLFGIAEVLTAVTEPAENRQLIRVRLRELLPTHQEWRRSWGAILRGSVLGFFMGLLPGPSPVISTFASYMVEKRLSRHPEEFGKGAIEAVAGPESANNAAVGGAYVPLLALGVPFTPAMAVVLGALLLHGITPGPLLMVQRPDIFWGVIASMYIGNLMLLILNLPFIGLFTSILRVPKSILLPTVVLLCLVGVYSVNASILDLWVLIIFGLVGFILRRYKFDVASLVLALVIGPMMEVSFRESMTIARGNPLIFFTRPLSGTLLGIGFLVIFVPALVSQFRKKSAKVVRRRENDLAGFPSGRV